MGSGVLSLPVGVAAFSSARTAILPALTLLAVAGAISGYCKRHTATPIACCTARTPARTMHRLHFLDSAGFSAVGRVCAATGSKSWGEAWSKSVGEHGVCLSVIGILTLSVSLQYTMVIGDFSSISLAWGLPSLIASRSGAIVFLTALGTLPLHCCPRSRRSASPLSSASAGCSTRPPHGRACARLQAGHGAAHRGTHRAAAALRQRARLLAQGLRARLDPRVRVPLPLRRAQLLQRARPGEGAAADAGPRKMKRFSLLTASSFALSAVLTGVVMTAGFLTFGGASDGYILNNYAPNDRLAAGARRHRLTTSSPTLPPGTARVDGAAQGRHRRGASARIDERGIIALVTALALRVTNLGLIAAVTGALVSTSIGYILPSLMLGQTLARRVADGDTSSGTRLELLAARAITALGVALAGIGVYAAV